MVADVVLADCTDAGRRETIRREILVRCKDALAYKVPAVIRFVERLDVTQQGSWHAPTRNVGNTA